MPNDTWIRKNVYGFEKILNIIPSTAVAEGKSGSVVPTTELAAPKAGA